METVQEGRNLHIMFDSMEDLETTGLMAANVTNGAAVQEWLNNKGGYLWFGTTDGKTAMNLVRNGWPAMYEKLLAMWGNKREELELAASTTEVRRRKRQRSDHGDTLDMHRVWNGQLDTAWERPVKMPRLSISQRHASIYIDLFCGANHNADSLLWRAAAAIQICDLLQTTGRAVEIHVGSSAENAYGDYDPKNVWTAIRAKGYTEPLQPEHLAAMCTAGFHRTFGFIARMATKYRIKDGLGYHHGEGLPINLKRRQEAGEVIVRIGRCTSRSEAEHEFSLVKAALAKKEDAT